MSEKDHLASLTSSYEEEHANLPPDARMAAIHAAQSGGYPAAGDIQAHSSHNTWSEEVQGASSQGSPGVFQHQPIHSDAPIPPGMMDIEMEETHRPSSSSAFLHMPQPTKLRTSGFSPNPSQSPWATAFLPQDISTTTQGVQPGLLSYIPSSPALQTGSLTQEQLQAKASKKAKRKAERAAAREEASASDVEGEKRFACPISGCGKVYKQANGLKYHLTRSINSGHGNVAALGGLSALLGHKATNTAG